jgi:hypothetical protein
MLGASPLDETRSTYVHPGVNKVVAQFVTSMSPYPKLPSPDTCVQESYSYLRLLCVLSLKSLYGSWTLLLTEEGTKYKMPLVPTPGPGWEDTPTPIVTEPHGNIRH